MSPYFVGKNYDGLFIENSGPELIYSSVLVTVFKGCFSKVILIQFRGEFFSLLKLPAIFLRSFKAI